jgi:hypothetical protein
MRVYIHIIYIYDLRIYMNISTHNIYKTRLPSMYYAVVSLADFAAVAGWVETEENCHTTPNSEEIRTAVMTPSEVRSFCEFQRCDTG